MARDVINLTPHPIRIYGTSAPDVVSADVAPRFTLASSGQVSHMDERRLVGHEEHVSWETYTDGVADAPVHDVTYGSASLPPVTPDVYLVVSLVTALAAPDRPDLLTPGDQVRSETGTVVGCRSFYRVHADTNPPAVRQLGADEQGIPWCAADLDRCEHGRHAGEVCVGCPTGSSAGNVFLTERTDTREASEGRGIERRIGTAVRGVPIWVSTGTGRRG